jgi:uncharacterized membrane protein
MNLANVIVYGLVKGLHDLATAVWIGGLIQLSFVVLPAFKNRLKDGKELRPLLMDIQKRLSLLVAISIPILVITGILESWHSKDFQGFFSFGNTYSALLSIKHILVVAMICIAISRKALMARNIEKLKSREKLSAMMVFANALIGVAVVTLSGFCSAVRA